MNLLFRLEIAEDQKARTIQIRWSYMLILKQKKCHLIEKLLQKQPKEGTHQNRFFNIKKFILNKQ